MNTAKDERMYTVDDIYELPDGERAELIDGDIYYMASPNTKHQRMISDFIYNIKDYIMKNNGSCEVFAAPFAVFINNDDINYVEPDISVICDQNKITEQGCVGAPDWIIEIVSPSSKRMDYFLKLVKYESSGVREYWIVDIDKEMITVHNFEKETMEQYSFGEDIPVGIYEDFSIKL